MAWLEGLVARIVPRPESLSWLSSSMFSRANPTSFASSSVTDSERVRALLCR